VVLAALRKVYIRRGSPPLLTFFPHQSSLLSSYTAFLLLPFCVFNCIALSCSTHLWYFEACAVILLSGHVLMVWPVYYYILPFCSILLSAPWLIFHIIWGAFTDCITMMLLLGTHGSEVCGGWVGWILTIRKIQNGQLKTQHLGGNIQIQIPARPLKRAVGIWRRNWRFLLSGTWAWSPSPFGEFQDRELSARRGGLWVNNLGDLFNLKWWKTSLLWHDCDLGFNYLFLCQIMDELKNRVDLMRGTSLLVSWIWGICLVSELGCVSTQNSFL